MRNVIITGITGFAGSYLAEYLLSLHDSEIHGTYLTDDSLKLLSGSKEKLHLHKINLMDAKVVGELIKKVKPHEIYHLAALTSPADSLKNPSETITNNIAAQTNVLEAVKLVELTNCRILITSSADIYGKVEASDLPIDEETVLRPTSPYAVSKIAQDYLGLQYFLSHKLNIIRVRPFNHIGPRQSPNFAVPSFTKQIAEIEKGKIESTIKVGNLTSRKDFTDVRDMVKAYALLMEKGVAGDAYNIGSGKSVQIEEILKKLLSLSDKKITISPDPERFRPNDADDFICDNKKFVDLTGWSPEIPLETTLEDTLNYWREQV